MSTLTSTNGNAPSPLRTLEGRVAVVTGSGRGIGKGIALELGQRGAKVVVNYASSTSAANEVVEALKALGAEAVAVKADVTKQDDIEFLFNTTMETFGRVDIVVSNSGIESFESALDLTPERFDHVFSVNARAQMFVAIAGYRYMLMSDPPARGRIILTSSIAARVMGVKNHALYAASKSAVEGITRSLATDFGPKGITVNAIAPGGIKSDMFHENAKHYIPGGLERQMSKEEVEAGMSTLSPLNRLGLPEDIGRVVSWLGSADSEWITGQVLLCSGGSEI